MNPEMTGHRIRRFRLRTDAFPVASLIERCFHPFLDPDGKRFIENLQHAGQEGGWLPLRWLVSLIELPIQGFVALNSDCKIIGAIHCFPCHTNLDTGYLIANVCVDPDYRRQGIATNLMKAAFTYAKNRAANRLFLQVRLETPEALTFYQNLGFQQYAFRTSWIRTAMPAVPTERLNLRLTRPIAKNTGKLRAAFCKMYPAEIIWNLNYDPNLLDDSAAGRLTKWLKGVTSQVYQIEDLQKHQRCWLVWQQTNSFTDTLWLAAEPGTNEMFIRDAVLAVAERHNAQKPLLINLPGTDFQNALEQAGFNIHNRLIWMSKDINRIHHL